LIIEMVHKFNPIHHPKSPTTFNEKSTTDRCQPVVVSSP
jgi:hypothetical protein